MSETSEEDVAVPDAFITGLNDEVLFNDSIDKKVEYVRKQHENLMEVVEIFRSKVDVMVDKQRNDFMIAYEAHIYDFQKELLGLKRRVKEIVNDSAREDKVKQLNISKEMYRSEALKLDVETHNMANTLRILTARTQKLGKLKVDNYVSFYDSSHSCCLEKERDWLLKKLRSSKLKLETLEKGMNLTLFCLLLV